MNVFSDGSSTLPASTKRKCDLYRQVAFSFGFRSRWSLHPSVIEMLGRSEFALRQGFACGKTLVRRKGAAGQKAGWMLLKKNCKRPERIWIVTPCHVGASVISLAPTFYASHEKSERAHFAAPPFHLRPASLGSQVVGGPAGGYFSFLAEILVLTALCKRKCGLF